MKFSSLFGLVLSVALVAHATPVVPRHGGGGGDDTVLGELGETLNQVLGDLGEGL